MTSTVVPPCKAVANWLKVFHAQGTESYTSSLTFTKRLTVVALSTLTYMKNWFPENCYTVETFAGLKLRILKNKCKDELAQFLSTALIQAFDALDKKYLHQLALCIYEDVCKQENLMEYYIFEYTYCSEGVAMTIHNKNRENNKQSLKLTFENVQDQTTKLIRACIGMTQSGIQHLPDSTDMSIRLYYNDDTPEDYQAPGYRFDNSGEDHLEATLSEAVQLGCVESPYHRTIAKSYTRKTIGDSCEANASSNSPVMPMAESEDFSGSAQRTVSHTPEFQLNCPCRSYEGSASDEKIPMLITCYYCNTMQHATCFGLLPEQVSEVKRHCCTRCSDENPDRAPTDAKLSQLTSKRRECLCIFRRTLEWCTQLSVIDGPILRARFGISLVNANKLLKLLSSYEIIRMEPDSDAPNKINVERLNLQINNFFRKNEEKDLSENLLAETFVSQETQHNEIGDVLSPTFQKVTLQNTFNLSPDIKTSNEDIAMAYCDPIKHYKNAISRISGEPSMKDKPSDGSHDIENVIETRSVTAKKVNKRKRKDDNEVKVDGKKSHTGLTKKRKIKGAEE